MSRRASVTLFFGVILKDDTIPPFDESDEGWDEATLAYLAWSGKADRNGVAIETFGHCENPYHAVVIASTVKSGQEWSPLPVKTREISPRQAARIEAFLKKHGLTEDVDRKASRVPGWYVVPYYG